MWTRTMLSGVAALTTLALATGCSNSGDSGTEQPPATTATAAPTTTAASDEAHNDADVMFAQHMIPHHQQAVEMSDILLAKQGLDPRVTELGEQIKAAQGPEITQMQGWLKQWGNPPMPMMPSASMPMAPGEMPGHGNMPMPSGDMPGGAMMPGMPGAPGGAMMPGMPGMMSQQDMTALRNAQGVEADKLFLTQMIRHHEGAITMAQDELKNGQFAAAKELAQSIATTQQQEIDTMKEILGSL